MPQSCWAQPSSCKRRRYAMGAPAQERSRGHSAHPRWPCPHPSRLLGQTPLGPAPCAPRRPHPLQSRRPPCWIDTGKSFTVLLSGVANHRCMRYFARQQMRQVCSHPNQGCCLTGTCAFTLFAQMRDAAWLALHAGHRWVLPTPSFSAARARQRKHAWWWSTTDIASVDRYGQARIAHVLESIKSQCFCSSSEVQLWCSWPRAVCLN